MSIVSIQSESEDNLMKLGDLMKVYHMIPITKNSPMFILVPSQYPAEEDDKLLLAHTPVRRPSGDTWEFIALDSGLPVELSANESVLLVDVNIRYSEATAASILKREFNSSAF